MKPIDLPSPGAVNRSQELRIAAARAISYCEVTALRSATAHEGAATLQAFFQACADALDELAVAPAPE